MMEPLISVVIPCYNGSDFLQECLDSVREQRVPCEIVIVDDGSTDDSLDRARRLVQRDPNRTFLIVQPNQGPAAARNTGLRFARGKYVCFLDVDDRYAPGFFAAALRFLEQDRSIVGVFCQIVLLNAHREVEPWQRQAIEASLPGNLLVRTEAAKRIGGFPVHRAFRGIAAGEDTAFRRQLLTFGRVVKIEKPLYRYRCRPGSHLDFFLDRVTILEGRSHFKFFSPEEVDGSLQKARQEYQASVAARARANALETFQTSLAAGTEFYKLFEQFQRLEGFLHPLEGFALYWLAKHWPVPGRVVEIGSFKGRSTCWLARGCQESQKGKVLAVDHFRGSPEHQPTGTHPDADIAATGSTLSAFQRNLAELGLQDWVEVRIGDSAEGSRQWHESARLLFIDGDHSYEGTAQDFSSWSRHVVPHGLVAFHDVNVWKGVTRFYQALLRDKQQWKELGRIRSLGILQRIAGRRVGILLVGRASVHHQSRIFSWCSGPWSGGARRHPTDRARF